MSEKYSLKIGHLFPDLLNLYGDAGNISALVSRMQWRGFSAEVIEYEINSEINFNDLDIVILGGGSDREQLLVCERLKAYKNELLNFVNSGGVVLALCGGFQILGKFFKIKDKIADGLGILDIYSEDGGERLIGNIVIESTLNGKTLKVAGFENHSSITFTGDCEPFGTVISGFGNNARDKKEGVLFKNVLGTNLHGPLLPKNPEVTDYLLKKALMRKYGADIALAPLDDSLENDALNYCIKNFS